MIPERSIKGCLTLHRSKYAHTLAGRKTAGLNAPTSMQLLSTMHPM